MTVDEKYMRMAIGLATKAEGETSPNPLVGALIVRAGRIVGRGYHKKAGLPHAEVNALRRAGSSARGATLYVTLEPCDHFGRTPPCTEAIIKSGLRKVVIGMKDPNPINNGKGIRRLNRSGIATAVGISEDEARSINRPYIKFITEKTPYVTVKMAQSLDGKIATRTGDSKWITGPDSRRYVQKLRGHVDAVMVGANTLKKDDPLLINKLSGGRQPVRIVVDSRLESPLGSRLFLTAGRSPVIAATTASSPVNKRRILAGRGVGVIVARSKRGRVDLADLLKKLAGRGITHILAEGGGELTAALIEEGLVDRAIFFIAPKMIGGREAVTSVEGEGAERLRDAARLKNVKIRRLSEDIVVEAEIERCSPV